MKNKLIISTLLSTLVLSSCSRGSSADEQPTSAVTPHTPPISYDYQFSREDISTVDLEEGKLLIDQFYWLDNRMKSSSSFSREKYQEKMHFGKSIEDITAQSIGYYLKNETIKAQVKKDIDHYFEDLELIANANQEANKGIAGWIGYEEERRYVNSYGEETGQVLQKALMGLTLLDRINNHHLSDEVLNNVKLQKDNSGLVLVPGKKYTELEHHWDMAFAYLGKENSVFKPLFIANYLEKETKDMPFLKGIDERVYKAYFLGRKAIAEKNYTEMNQQAAIIKKELNTLFAARAIYYLKKAIPDLKEDPRNAFHGLSEAYGFIYALNATLKNDNTPYLNHSEIQQLLSDLRGTDGFWEIDRLAADSKTKGSLLYTAQTIATAYGFNLNEI